MALSTILLALLACVLSSSRIEAQTSGSVRLVGKGGVTSSSLTAGRLEVYYNGQWGTVCDDGFGYYDARTVCKQLGYSGYLEYGTISSTNRFDVASSSTRIWLDNLSCSSSATRLSQCSHNGIGVHNCVHNEDVFVSCLGEGALKIVRYSYSSTTYSSGRLEIYHSSQWGTVCDDRFGQTDATVACRQLGYESASSYGNVGTLGYSEGSGRTWLDEVQCTSADIMLSSCSHNTYGVEDCSHSEDIALRCSSTAPAISSGSARLVGKGGVTSSNLTAGRLEVYYNGQWGTVCNNSFGYYDVQTVCQQLGYSGYLEYGTISTTNRFDAASSSTRIWLDNLSCSYSDTSLSQCNHNTIGVNSCTHSQDVYVSCLGEGALRIVRYSYSSTTYSSGRLEIYHSSQWGTVCDDSFGQTDANVACRQLGYESASSYGTVGTLGYSEGSGRTWLDEVQCTSADIMLSSCSHNTYGVEDCSHSEDIALICNSGFELIRLVGKDGVTSSNLTAGRLEVYYNGQWGTVCDNGFSSYEATTACKQLGFSNYLEFGTISSRNRFDTASSSTRIWLDSLSCSYDDTSLSQCTHKGVGVVSCTHNQDVYVSCLGEGALRIVRYTYSSTTYSSGRLEIYHSSQWGTVCDDSFGQTDANVACRQLGYESASSYGTVGTLGYNQGTGNIWLDNVRCTSTDTMLSSCLHNGFGIEDCSHYEDIAVSCSSVSHTISGSGLRNEKEIAGVVVAVCIFFIAIIAVSVTVCIAFYAGACRKNRASNRGTRDNITFSRQNNNVNIREGTATTSNSTATVAVASSARGAQAPPPSYANYLRGSYPVQAQSAAATAHQGQSPSQALQYPQVQYLYPQVQAQQRVQAQMYPYPLVVAQGQNQVPAQGQNQVPAQGQNQVPAQGQNQVPAQGQNQGPTQGQNQVPAQGQNQGPAQGQNQVQIQGPVHDQQPQPEPNVTPQPLNQASPQSSPEREHCSDETPLLLHSDRLEMTYDHFPDNPPYPLASDPQHKMEQHPDDPPCPMPLATLTSDELHPPPPAN